MRYAVRPHEVAPGGTWGVGVAEAEDMSGTPRGVPRGGLDPRRETGHLVRFGGHRARGVVGETGPVPHVRGTGVTSPFSGPRRASVFLALTLFAAAPLALAAPGGAANPRWQQVIVSGTAGSVHAVEHAVTAAGGHIRKVLPVVNGVS